MSEDSNNLSKPHFGCYFCHSVVAFLEHMDYLWFMKKLKKYCVWFRRYKKRFVIRDPKWLNSIPGYDGCFGWRARFHMPSLRYGITVHGMPCSHTWNFRIETMISRFVEWRTLNLYHTYLQEQLTEFTFKTFASSSKNSVRNKEKKKKNSDFKAFCVNTIMKLDITIIKSLFF